MMRSLSSSSCEVISCKEVEEIALQRENESLQRALGRQRRENASLVQMLVRVQESNTNVADRFLQRIAWLEQRIEYYESDLKEASVEQGKLCGQLQSKMNECKELDSAVLELETQLAAQAEPMTRQNTGENSPSLEMKPAAIQSENLDPWRHLDLLKTENASLLLMSASIQASHTQQQRQLNERLLEGMAHLQQRVASMENTALHAVEEARRLRAEVL